MTRLFRDSLDAIDSDLREINQALSESMREITGALRKLVEGGGTL